MKRILFSVAIVLAASHLAQAQVFNNNTDGDFGKPHVAWTNSSGAGNSTVGAIVLTALGGQPGTIIDVSLAIQGLTVTNSDKMSITLTNNISGQVLSLAQVDTQSTDPGYTNVDVTFRNNSAAFGSAGIGVGGFSYVGVDPNPSTAPDFDVFDGMDPDSNWTVAISSSEVSGDAAWTNITLGGFSVAAVPEPASLSLFGLGLMGLGTYRRRRQKVDRR